MWPFRRRRAEGGQIPPASPQRPTIIVVHPGTAVVTDEMLAKHGRAYFERINGRPTKVYSVSEALRGDADD